MKNPPTLLYERLTPVTPKKRIMQKILIVAEVISHYLKDTLGKTRFEIWPLLCFFGGFYKLKWPN